MNVGYFSDLPQLPSADDKVEEGSTPCPPSRGTGVTFSEYSVDYSQDGAMTRRTSSTSNTLTTNTGTDFTKRLDEYKYNDKL
jgi:hypothetical protein